MKTLIENKLLKQVIKITEQLFAFEYYDKQSQKPTAMIATGLGYRTFIQHIFRPDHGLNKST